MADRVRLKGKGYWNQGLFEARTFTSQEGKSETNWSFQFAPDDDCLDVLYGLQREGMKNQIGREPGKGFVIRLKRPQSKKMRGELTEFSPPVIKDDQGNTWDKTKNIPDGTEMYVDISVYSHRVGDTDKKAKAVRLEGVQVIQLANIGNPQPQE